MNQPQPTTKPQSKMLKWLLVILGVVILAAVGVYVFYIKGGNVGGVLSLSSPTPTKSAAVLPSGTTKTSTPASGTTPSDNQPSSPEASPQTPPAGWKKFTNRAVGAGPAFVEFSIYVKNDWSKYNENDTAHGPVFYTSNTNCAAGRFGPEPAYQNCWDHLAFSYSSMTGYTGASNLTIRSFPYSASDGNTYNAYVGVNKSISDSEQKIIFDSFQVVSTN